MKINDSRLLQKGSLSLVRMAAYMGFAVALTSTAQLAMATDYEAPAQHGVSLDLGSLGLGLSYSKKANVSLKEGDHVQWRLAISGLSGELDDDDVDINNTDYDNVDLSLFALKGGADWYPFSRGWQKQVFLSGGLMYNDLSLKGSANLSKRFKVGGKLVTPGDINGLTTDIDDSQILPYLSMGWGNRLRDNTGIGFMVEAGVAMATQDVDVSVSADDPNNVLNASLLKAEQQNIQNDLDGARGFITASIVYHF